jgi:hypothetical protein
MLYTVVISGVDPVVNPSDRLYNIVVWLKQHSGVIGIDWDSGDGKTFKFRDGGVATLFALKWSGNDSSPY